MTILATLLWLAIFATPVGMSSPFAFQARHRTPGKITAAFIIACWLSAGLAIAAVKL